MPVVNIVDRRTNKYCVDVDAVFEPSWHDNSIKQKHKSTTLFNRPEKDEIHCENLNRTTVLEAIIFAHQWTQDITMFLYDTGSYPIGK